MRVLFSNPPWYTSEGPDRTSLRGVRAGSRWPHQFEYRSNGPVNGYIPELVGGYIPFPVFLGTASALARKHGHDAEIRDSVASGETYETFYTYVEQRAPEVVVIETSTPTLKHDIGVVDEIRRRVAGVTVIFTGMHFELEEASFLARYPQVDFTVYGEYENATVTVIDRLANGETSFAGIEGLVYRDNGNAVKADAAPSTAADHDDAGDGACATETGGGCGSTSPVDAGVPATLRLVTKSEIAASAPVVRNDFKKLVPMEQLPWADRDGLPMANYYDGVCGLERPQLQLMATRGCPYGCIFCGWPQMIYRGPKYRVRTAQDVVAEIKANLEKVPYKSFYIDDDTVNIRKKYVLELAQAIKDAGLNTIPWGTMGRADLMDEEMILALKDAGLFSIKYGVETADQELLNEIKKNIKIDEVIAGIELTKKHGIKVHLTFTFGLPSDTPETIERTIQLACRLPVDTVQFSITTPYPGTEMYRLYKKNGWLLNENWEEYLGSHKAVARTANFTAEQLEDAVKQAYSRFWEEQALRRLRTPEFEARLRAALPDLTGRPTRVLVTQSARPGLTRVVLQSLSGLGYEPHVLTHERFVPSFQSDFEPHQIHTFAESYNFDAKQMSGCVAKLAETGGFAAVVVPYHNATGANYGEVHEVAARVTPGPIVGVTVTAAVLPVGRGRSSATPLSSAVNRTATTVAFLKTPKVGRPLEYNQIEFAAATHGARAAAYVSAAGGGGEFRGLPVVAPADLRALGVDFVVSPTALTPEELEPFTQAGWPLSEVLSYVTDRAACVQRWSARSGYLAARRPHLVGGEIAPRVEYADIGEPVVRDVPSALSSDALAAITARVFDAYQRATKDAPAAGPHAVGRNWGAFLRSTRPRFYEAVERRDLEVLSDLLANCFRNEMTSGTFGTAVAYEAYRSWVAAGRSVVSGVRQQFNIWRYCVANPDVSRLASPAVGNPFGLQVGQSIVHPNTFLNDSRAQFVSDLLSPINRPIVLDLGGGFGGFGHQLLASGHGEVYLDFDLPENLLVAAYFLMAAHPEKRVLLYESPDQKLDASTLREYDIVLMPNFMLPRVPGRTVNLFSNFISLSEMDYPTIAGYFEQIDRVCDGYFYHENLLDNGENYEFYPLTLFPPLAQFKTLWTAPSRWPFFSAASVHHCHGEVLAVRRDLDPELYLARRQSVVRPRRAA